MSEPHRRLFPGTPAPEFSATTWEGERVDLAQLRGRKLWLAFFRHVNCPFCNLRIHEMQQRAGAWRGQLQIVAVFQSPATKFKGAPLRAETWYPLISDPEETLYRLYGLSASLQAMLNPAIGMALVRAAVQGYLPRATDGSFGRIPADFLIDAEGVISDAYYGSHIADHIPLPQVEAFLAEAAAVPGGA